MELPQVRFVFIANYGIKMMVGLISTMGQVPCKVYGGCHKRMSLSTQWLRSVITSVITRHGIIAGR